MTGSASVEKASGLKSDVAQAQSELSRSMTLAGLERDPLGHAYRALSTTIGLFPELVARIEATTHQVPSDVLRQAVFDGISAHAWKAVRVTRWRTVLLATMISVVALVAAAGGGYWFRGAVPLLIGVRAGAEKCEDRPDGSRLCWIPVLERLPTPR